MDTRGKPIYKPLTRDLQQIRLLSVDRPPFYDDDDDDNIPRLTLRSYFLASRTDAFYAVSYTWGTDLPSNEVIINGRKVLVSDNVFMLLEEFLSTSLAKGSCQDLWIDSICINQGDVEERNQQVRWMGDIYSMAKGTLIWLDERSIDRMVAPTIVKRVKEADRSMQKAWQNIDTDEDFDNPSPSLRAVMEELWCIFSHPYWKRLWIVQEVVLARDTKLMLHAGVTTFDEWALALPLEQRYYQKLSAADKKLHSEAHSNMRQLRLLLHYRELPEARSLAGLLKTCREHLCANPKDMIYGLLGLADDGDQMPIDYRKDNVELFFDALEVTYPAEEVSEQIESINKLLQALQIQLSDLYDHVADAEGEHRARLLARIFPLHLQIVGQKLLVNSKTMTQPPVTDLSKSEGMAPITLLDCCISDASVQEHLMFSQRSGESPCFVCLFESILPPLPTSSSEPTTTTTETTTVTVYCSAWELLLFFSLGDGRFQSISPTARDQMSSSLNKVVNENELNQIVAESFSATSDGVFSSNELLLNPIATAEHVEPAVVYERPAEIADELAALALETNLSRGEQLRKRAEYWRKIRMRRIIDHLHSTSFTYDEWS